MSVVKYQATPKKPLSQAIEYALKCEKDGAPVYFENLSPTGVSAYEEIRTMQELNRYRKPQKYRSVIYGFSDEEKKILSPKQMMNIGKDFARKAFPKHQFVMGMHNDTDKPHLHIVFNIVNPETGKIIQNKMEVKRLRALNDKVLKSRGLRTLDEYKRKDLSKEEMSEAKERYNLNQKRYKYSHLRFVKDLKQKANWARGISTNFDEYAAALDAFNIKVRVGNKNISYLYPDRKVPMRGKYLSDELSKNGLTKGFASNTEKFAKDPFLGVKAGKNFEAIRNGNLNKDELLKNLERFNSGSRRQVRYHSPDQENLHGMMISNDEIKKAKRQSLRDYVSKNKIKTFENEKGQTVLKGREHIVINNNSWTNTKNNTQGTIIDFVAVHHRTTYIDAISRLNNNHRLKALSKSLGESGTTFQSFHVPKEKRANYQFALTRLSHLLKQKKVNPTMSKKLMEGGRVHVDIKGDIHFFGENDERGSIVYHKDEKEKWKKERQGILRSPFFSSKGRSNKAIIFTDPFSLAKQNQSFKSYQEKKDTYAAFTDKDPLALDIFLANNNHIDEILIFTEKKKKMSKRDQKYLRKLKRRFDPLGIRVSTTHEIDRGRDRSLDFNR